LIIDPSLFLFQKTPNAQRRTPNIRIQTFEIRSVTSTITRDARPARS
jgi:hypothetical protein